MRHILTLLVARATRSRRMAGALVVSLWVGLATPAHAQVPLNPTTPAAADTTHKYENPIGVPTPAKRPFFKSKAFKALAVPAVLIGYGAYTFNGGGFYTNQEANRDIHRLFPTYRTKLDNYLIFVPYLELGAVALAGVESRNDRINVGLIILKGELIMLGSTFVVKALSHEERPDGADNLSFPSGHTALAFTGAGLLDREFGGVSPLIPLGGYAAATATGALRVLNDKHWVSDVLVGAGIGLLSAEVAYHVYPWLKRKLVRRKPTLR